MDPTQGKTLIARVFEHVLPSATDFFRLLAEQSRHVEDKVEPRVEFTQTGGAEIVALRDMAHAAGSHRIEASTAEGREPAVPRADVCMRPHRAVTAPPDRRRSRRVTAPHWAIDAIESGGAPLEPGNRS